MIRRITPVILGGLAVYLAYRACQPQQSRTHRDGCPCSPCREFSDHAEMAVRIVTGCPRGLPRDGERLTQPEWRELRGIEAASNRKQARQS